jgi:hypothetical protein
MQLSLTQQAPVPLHVESSQHVAPLAPQATVVRFEQTMPLMPGMF